MITILYESKEGINEVKTQPRGESDQMGECDLANLLFVCIDYDSAVQGGVLTSASPQSLCCSYYSRSY